MANKTITMLQLRKILQLKEQGYSNRRIKGVMNLSRQTVDDYVKRLKQTDKSYKELLKLDSQRTPMANCPNPGQARRVPNSDQNLLWKNLKCRWSKLTKIFTTTPQVRA